MKTVIKLGNEIRASTFKNDNIIYIDFLKKIFYVYFFVNNLNAKYFTNTYDY